MGIIKTRRRSAALAASVAALALIVSACGSSSSDDKATAAGTKSSGSAATGTPIKIGYASQDTGTAANPDATKGVQAAVDYLNKEKGGLNGHPIQLVNCDTKETQAGAQACGQQFANDSSIPVVLGPMLLQASAFHGALNGKPLFMGLAITPDQNTLSHTYAYITAFTDTFTAYANYILNNLHAKSVSFIHNDDPSMQAAAPLLAGIFKKAGVSFKDTSVPSAASDILPQVSKSGAATADVTFVMGENNCNIYSDAFKSLGIKPKAVLSGSSCLAKPMQTDYSKFIGWTMLNPWAITTDTSNPDVKTYLAAWTKYTGTKTPGYLSEVGWFSMINLANAINAAKPATLDSASIEKAIASYTGPADFGHANVDCGAHTGSITCVAPNVLPYTLTAQGLKAAS